MQVYTLAQNVIRHITLALSWHKGWSDMPHSVEMEGDNKKKMPITEVFQEGSQRRLGHKTGIADNIIIKPPSIFGIIYV